MRDNTTTMGRDPGSATGRPVAGCGRVANIVLSLLACCATAEPSLPRSLDPSPSPIVACKEPADGEADAESTRQKYRRCLEKACQDGVAAGCTRLADIYRVGEGVARDAAFAALMYRQACDGGDVGGCHHLANMYFVGDGVPRDHERAIAMYNELCAQGFPTVCQIVGYLYETGQGGLPRDRDRAVHFYDLACEGGFFEGCKRLLELQQRRE